jgi:NADH:ubiquinone oxidoreductase subunit 6 (subunit J)
VIATIAFVVLALVSLAAVLGLLVSHRLPTAIASFGLYTAALVLMYVLLNLRFAAAVQLAVNVTLAAALWVGIPGGEMEHVPKSSNAWYALAAAPFAVLACWSVAQGTVGESAPDLIPVWATRGSYLQAVGGQLLSSYLVPFLLVALLLMVSVVAVAYVTDKGTESGEEKHA